MTIRLVVWNCADGFEQKHAYLSNLRADIAVIPEVRWKAVEHLAPTAAWMGEEGKKGLLVLVPSDWTISPWPLDLPAETRHFLAATIRTPDEKAFDLLAVWAKRSEDYVRPTLRAIEAFASRSTHPIQIVGGDFNQSVCFDSGKSYQRSFRKVIDVLGELGLTSAWHRFHGEEHGQELTPTLFFLRSRVLRYHIDYVFVPTNLELASVELGSFESWVAEKRSDHVPLTADIKLPLGRA